jgi:hypothetical protein
MGVALAAGAIAAAFLNIDKLQKFKGAGIEVELKQAVAEAQATLENLKEFTTPLFVFSIKYMSEGQTANGIPIKQQHDIVQSIEKIAEKNEISTDLKEAVERFYNLNMGWIFNKISSEVHKYRRSDIEKMLWQLKDDNAAVYPSEKQLRDLLKDLPHISSELNEAIENYAYYRQNKYPR